MKKNGFIRFILGMAIGYGCMQGIIYLNQNYLWTLFYR